MAASGSKQGAVSELRLIHDLILKARNKKYSTSTTNNVSEDSTLPARNALPSQNAQPQNAATDHTKASVQSSPEAVDDTSNIAHLNKSASICGNTHPKSTRQDRKAILDALREKKFAQMKELQTPKKTIKINLKPTHNFEDIGNSALKISDSLQTAVSVPSIRADGANTESAGKSTLVRSTSSPNCIVNSQTDANIVTSESSKKSCSVLKGAKNAVEMLDILLQSKSVKNDDARLFNEIKVHDDNHIATTPSSNDSCTEKDNVPIKLDLDEISSGDGQCDIVEGPLLQEDLEDVSSVGSIEEMEEGEITEDETSGDFLDKTAAPKQFEASHLRLLIAGDNRATSLVSDTWSAFSVQSWCINNDSNIFNFCLAIDNKLAQNSKFDVVLIFAFHLSLVLNFTFHDHIETLMKSQIGVSIPKLMKAIKIHNKRWSEMYPHIKFIWATPYPIDFRVYNNRQLQNAAKSTTQIWNSIGNDQSSIIQYWNYVKEINKCFKTNMPTVDSFPLHLVLFNTKHDMQNFIVNPGMLATENSCVLPRGFLLDGIQPALPFQQRFSSMFHQYFRKNFASLVNNPRAVVSAYLANESSKEPSLFAQRGDCSELQGNMYETLGKHRELYVLYHQTPSQHPQYERQMEQFTWELASNQLHLPNEDWFVRNTDVDWKTYWVEFLKKDFDMTWNLKKCDLYKQSKIVSEDPRSNIKDSHVKAKHKSSKKRKYSREKSSSERSSNSIIISSDSETDRHLKRDNVKRRSRSNSTTSDRHKRHKSKHSSNKSHRHQSRSRKRKRKHKARRYSSSDTTSTSEEDRDDEKLDVDELITKARSKMEADKRKKLNRDKITVDTMTSPNPDQDWKDVQEIIPIASVANPGEPSRTVERPAALNSDLAPAIYSQGVGGSDATVSFSKNIVHNSGNIGSHYKSIINESESVVDNSDYNKNSQLTVPDCKSKISINRMCPIECLDVCSDLTTDINSRSELSGVPSIPQCVPDGNIKIVGPSSTVVIDNLSTGTDNATNGNGAFNDDDLNDKLDSLFDNPDFMSDLQNFGDEMQSLIANDSSPVKDDNESNEMPANQFSQDCYSSTMASSSVTENLINSTVKTTQAKRGNYMVEVLRILNNVADHFGPLSVSIASMYKKALECLENAQDPITLLNKNSSSILEVIDSKLKRFIADPNTSEVRRALYNIASKELRTLLDDPQSECDMFFGINIANIAKATVGSDTGRVISFIKNTLMYHGMGEVSKDDVMRIFMAVKSVQLKLLDGDNQLIQP